MKILINIIYIFLLIRIAHKDMKTKTIPNSYLLPLVILMIIAYLTYKPVVLMDGILGGLVISLPMLIFTMIKPGSFGGGDIKLLSISGIFLGSTRIVIVFIIGIIMAAIYIVIKYAQGKLQLNSTIPLGPFLAGACILALFL